MDMIKTSAAVKRLAGLELNDLLLSKNLPADLFDDTKVSSAGTLVYDTNGSLLLRRVPLKRGRQQAGYTDIAVNPALGYPFLSASSGQPWNEKALVEQGAKALLGQYRGIRHDSVRFVAYSYPKLALQFLLKGEEVGMLELFTWRPVPKMSS